jgi:hypothetical protein
VCAPYDPAAEISCAVPKQERKILGVTAMDRFTKPVSHKQSAEFLDHQRLIGQVVDHADEREVEPLLEHGERPGLLFGCLESCHLLLW